MAADLRRQWYEQGKARAVTRAQKREAAFRRQEAFVQRARQLRELRQGAQQAKYAKQQERMLAEKVFATLNLHIPHAYDSDPHHGVFIAMP